MTENLVPTPLQAFVDAINNADTDAFVAAFTPDGFVDDWGRILSGPDGVRSWAATDAIGADAQMTILDTTVTGDRIEVRFGWKSRVFNGESTAIAVTDGDKLASFKILPSH